jgi:hypothetical protein
MRQLRQEMPVAEGETMSDLTEPRFTAALRGFDKLAGVDNDPSRTKTIADLVFIAQFEIDLFDEGDSCLTAKQVAPIRRFVKRWGA